MGRNLYFASCELRAARNALEAMRQAQAASDYLDGWGTLVDRLERVWTKVERECQGFKNQFNPWQGKFTKLRKDDELLRYLCHARNACQHTIEFVAGITVGFTLQLQGEKGQIVINEESGQITFHGLNVLEQKKPRFALLPFKDRGVTYEPPTEHLGLKQEFDPLSAAEAGLAFYENFVQQAEEKFFPAPSADPALGIAEK